MQPTEPPAETPAEAPTEPLPLSGPWSTPASEPATAPVAWWPVVDIESPVEVDSDGPGMLGPILGGAALTALILGLAVYGAWGMTGLLAAGASTAVAGTGTAAGVAAVKNRAGGHRRRPTAKGRLGRAGSGTLRRPSLRGGASRGRSAVTPGTRRRASSGVGGSLARMLGGGGRASKRAGAMPMRRARPTGRGGAPLAGLFGRRRMLGRGRKGSGVAQLLPLGANRRTARGLARVLRRTARPTSGARQAAGALPATWRQRRRAAAAMRHNWRLNQQRLRYERRGHRAADRHDRRTMRRTARRTRWAAHRSWAASRLFKRPGSWAARTMVKRPGLLAVAGLAWLGLQVRALLRRIPGWLWAPPRPDPIAPAATQPPAKPEPDAHDDEQDSDAPTVRRPGRRRRKPTMAAPAVPIDAPAVPTPRSRRKGAAMHPSHQAVVDAYAEAIGNFQPPEEDAFEELEDFFRSWQEMFAELGTITTGLAERFRDETPVETVPDYLDEVASGLSNMAEGAGEEVYGSWRTGNAADIERAENGRPNERMLNVR